jgi:hypothetical protein
MPPELSIVRVDKRKYRTIAQENWGLTKEQMKGMHVHHRIPIFKGGTDDPTNLYVCSPSFHRWGWHNGEEWIEWASEGAKAAHSRKNKQGKSVTAVKAAERAHAEKDEQGRSALGVRSAERLHAERDEQGRSAQGVKNAERLHAEKDALGRSIHALNTIGHAHSKKDELGRSILGVRNAERLHSEKDEFGRSVHGVKVASKTNSQKWIDPDHPELGEHSAPTLAQMQKRRGYPYDKENRVRVG